MTFIWFIVWFVSDHVGGRAPLHFAPANPWAWTLLLVIALDLGTHHARGAHRH